MDAGLLPMTVKLSVLHGTLNLNITGVTIDLATMEPGPIVEYMVPSAPSSTPVKDDGIEGRAEEAFWRFDATRKRTGAERDAFKGEIRHALRNPPAVPVWTGVDVAAALAECDAPSTPDAVTRRTDALRAVARLREHCADYGYGVEVKESRGPTIAAAMTGGTVVEIVITVRVEEPDGAVRE